LVLYTPRKEALLLKKSELTDLVADGVNGSKIERLADEVGTWGKPVISPKMFACPCVPRTDFEVTLQYRGFVLVPDSDVGGKFPRAVSDCVLCPAIVVFFHPGGNVVSDADVSLHGVLEASEDIDIPHGIDPLHELWFRPALLRASTPLARVRAT